jgi:hypothetical protein
LIAAHRYWLVTWPDGEHRFSMYPQALAFVLMMQDQGHEATIKRVTESTVPE